MVIASPLLLNHLLTGSLDDPVLAGVHHCYFRRVSIESAGSVSYPASLKGSRPALSLLL